MHQHSVHLRCLVGAFERNRKHNQSLSLVSERWAGVQKRSPEPLKQMPSRHHVTLVKEPSGAANVPCGWGLVVRGEEAVIA